MQRPGHRPEIQGLRGLGMMLVVAYHLWGGGRISGGVDVFLAISAFLLTRSFVRRAETFEVRTFVVQRFRRLVPLAAIVIVATLLAGYVLVAPQRHPELLSHAEASLFYRENWQLIQDALAYGDTDPDRVNPFQHFWSLSVQGQVFLGFGVLFWVTHLLARRGVNARLVLGVALAAAGAASFAWAVVSTRQAPEAAYLATDTRVWEFALAGLLGLVPDVELPRPVRTPLGWVGLGLVLATGPLVGGGAFPGPVALVPLAGTAAVILAGASADDRTQAAWWLGRRPVTFVANRAYSTYLWHWPILALWISATHEESPRVGLTGSLVVLALTAVLADASTRLVERRFQSLPVLTSKRVSLAVITLFGVLVLSLSRGLGWLTLTTDQRVATAPVEQRPGARSLDPENPATAFVPTRRSIAPGDAAIASDWPPTLPPCASASAGDPPSQAGTTCQEYLPAGEPSATVLLLGDSHTAQWLSAVLPLAYERDWHVIAYIRLGCRLALEDDLADPECAAYGVNAVDYALRLRPTYVVGVGSRVFTGGDEIDFWPHVRAVAPLGEAGITVVNIRDNPRFAFSMPLCVQTRGAEDDRCTPLADTLLAGEWPRDSFEGVPNQRFLDFTDFLCPPEMGRMCPGVIGNVYVYMDSNHLSRTYVESLSADFAAAWAREVDR